MLVVKAGRKSLKSCSRSTTRVCPSCMPGERHRITRPVLGVSLLGEVPSSLPRALECWLQILNTLAYLQQNGLPHSNLTRRTIVVPPSGHVKLTEVGARTLPNYQECADDLADLSFLSGDALMGPKSTGGEQFEAGSIGYYLFTGQTLYQGDFLQILQKLLSNEVKRPPTQLRAELPKAVEEVILRMLSHNPADRYPDLAQAEAAARKAVLGCSS